MRKEILRDLLVIDLNLCSVYIISYLSTARLYFDDSLVDELIYSFFEDVTGLDFRARCLMLLGMSV